MLRIYLRHGSTIWRIFTVFLKQSGFYYTFQPNKAGFNFKFSYHPKKEGEEGTLIHAKAHEPNSKARVITSKKGWPDLLTIDIVPIDTIGLSTLDLLNDDPFLKGLKKIIVKSPNLIFDLVPSHPDFSLRMYLCKTELLTTNNEIIDDKIKVYTPEQLIDRKIHNFKEININGSLYNYSLIVDYVSVPSYV